MAEFDLRLTEKGVQLLAQAAAGERISFLKMVMGDGSYSGDPSAVEEVISPKQEVAVSGISREGNRVSIRGVLPLGSVKNPFRWRELGLYAENPASGLPLLAAYGNACDKGDYVAAGGAADERILEISLVTDAAANITADVSGVLFAGEKEFQAHRADSAAHNRFLLHQKSGKVHALTGLSGAGGMVSCQFKAAAAYIAGDTFTVDGTPYAVKLTNGEAAEDDLFVSGAAVSCIVDAAGKTVNFKSGGGLSASKLALATAGVEDVLSGKTFYAGDRAMKTGTLKKGAEWVQGSVSVGTSYPDYEKTVVLPGQIQTLVGTISSWTGSTTYFFFYDLQKGVTNKGNSLEQKITVSGNRLTVDNYGGSYAETFSYIAYCI